jgi:hypothetical protein
MADLAIFWILNDRFLCFGIELYHVGWAALDTGFATNTA